MRREEEFLRHAAAEIARSPHGRARRPSSTPAAA
jgi:hypothetical protein